MDFRRRRPVNTGAGNPYGRKRNEQRCEHVGPHRLKIDVRASLRRRDVQSPDTDSAPQTAETIAEYVLAT